MVHQINLPLDGIRRQNSGNVDPLNNNESVNTSKSLDPDDFYMSNTSTSQFTQSMVQGADTDRNLMKDSRFALPIEDPSSSNVLKDLEDEQPNRKYAAADDTPHVRKIDEVNIMQPHEPSSDFIMCQDNLEIDAELPHLNQTSSNLISKQFRYKEQPSNIASTTRNDNLMAESTSSVTKLRKKSTTDNDRFSKRNSDYGSVKAKVQESISNMRSVLKNNGMQP